MILTKSNFDYKYYIVNKYPAILVIIFIILQFTLWLKTESIKPNITIIPDLPSKHSIKALSLGDEEFYFRVLALNIQNAGDSFGNFIALKYYDYNKLYKWLKLLDDLNGQSKLMPSLVSYYYAQTQTKSDTIYLIKYLDEFASKDLDENWWWMFQAFFIANFTLKDKDIALEKALKLSKNNNKDAPIWTKQLPAFLYAKRNEGCTAFSIIEQLLKDHESGIRVIDKKELDFMHHFIENRLQSLERKNFNPLKCKK